jgi:hypothetical protein
MTTSQSNDDVRRDGGAEVSEFIDAPPAADTDRPEAGDEKPQTAERESDERNAGVPGDCAGRPSQYPDAAHLPEPDAPSRSIREKDS